jgi:neprosin-like protein
MNEDGHVSNSRRGLLAAGLAAAVVGSMGVVWTLNANADETPAAEIPAAAANASEPVAEEADPALVPPKLLPWGAKPERLKRARNGVSSAAVAAAGADVASADTSGSLVPTAEFAPKGRDDKAGRPRSKARPIPPSPPPIEGAGVLTAKVDDRPVNFHYAGAGQYGDTDGTWANLNIAKPDLDVNDYHTLAEITVRSADGRQIVEVGWNIDRAVNGDADPHLFVFYWRDRVPTCYNACGFEMYSKTMKPGDTLPAGTQKRFGIQHSGGAWWIAYDSEWIGAFPDKLWDGTYTRGGRSQWFGEVASPSLTPCTDMGNGLNSPDPNAARVGSISMTNGPEVAPVPRDVIPGYSMTFVKDTVRTFRFGGSGSGGSKGDGVPDKDGTCPEPKKDKD